MNNRNPNTTSRERRDSASDKERRGMQQGFPVRKDAARSFGQSINLPDGPREVPLSLRQGKIPVRKDASTGRTFPVMNRSGQKTHDVPLPAADETQLPAIPESAENENMIQAAPEPEKTVMASETAAEEAAPDTEPETEPETAGNETAAETEPIAPEEEASAEAEAAEDEPPAETETAEAAATVQADSAEDETEAEAVDADPVPEAVSEPVPEEPAAEAEPESVENESPEETVSAPAPEEPPETAAESAENKPAAGSEPETAADEPIEPPVFVQRKRTEAETAPVPSDTMQDEDPLETTREFDKVPSAAAAAAEPSDDAASVPADTDGDTSGTGTKKLWILPLVIAILAALGLCIGIPAMTAREGSPDFDMSADYETAEPETDGTVSETLPDDGQPAKFSVTLTLPGQSPVTVSTAEITLEALLDRIGYTIQDSDWFPVDPGTLLTEETDITVETIVRTTETETITLPYETIVTELQTIPRGQKDIIQKGQTGTKVITYAIESVGGKEISRTVADEKITKQPVNETYQLGVGGTLVGNDGKTYSYSYYRIVNATYYDLEGLTYLGYDADESVVAVDKNCIPLGTEIYVKNDQFDFGVRTAADTGSFKGWEVDIWLDDSNPQKAEFARLGYVNDMVIYYLD